MSRIGKLPISVPTGVTVTVNDALLCQRLTDHHARRHFCKRNTGGFGDKRYGTRRTRVDFNQVNFVVLHRKLDVHQTTNLQFEGQFLHLLAHHVLNFLAQRVGWQGTRGVAGVNARLNALISYLNAQAELDQTLGTTLESWDISLND